MLEQKNLQFEAFFDGKTFMENLISKYWDYGIAFVELKNKDSE